MIAWLRRPYRVLLISLAFVGGFLLAGRIFLPGWVVAQGLGVAVPALAGDAQHSGLTGTPAMPLGAIRWHAPLSTVPSTVQIGSPVVTAANVIIAPVRTPAGIRLDGFDGRTGERVFEQETGYIEPSHTGALNYGPVLATHRADGKVVERLYYAGPAGTLLYIESPDAAVPSAPVRRAFYGDAAYASNPTAFTASVFVNTPLTADAHGNVFFGFRVQGNAPLALTDGVARITPDGTATYVSLGQVPHNSAPAISTDGSLIYVIAGDSLAALDAATLATVQSAALRDPQTGSSLTMPDGNVVAPVVAPDGDVFISIGRTSGDAALLHFSGDLSIEKLAAIVASGSMPAIVPAAIVPEYGGSSPYLVLAEYGGAPALSAGGSYRVALLDPSSSQEGESGFAVMREVLSALGPTADPARSSERPDAVRPWGFLTVAVSEPARSAYLTSDDGRVYRWQLDANALSESLPLVAPAAAAGPLAQTQIGPDGSVLVVHGSTLFVLGTTSETLVTLSSSSADMRDTVADDSLTFTARVRTADGPSTGTVTFEDEVYRPGIATAAKRRLGVEVLDSAGQAVHTVPQLEPGVHVISATHVESGAAATFVQRVHVSPTTVEIVVAPEDAQAALPLTITATVLAANGGVPSGMITFLDGTRVIAQLPLVPASGAGLATITTPGLTPGRHSLTAVYHSDSRFARSTGEKELELRRRPVISWTVPASITHGDALSDLQLNAVADVPGVFEYQPAAGTVLSPGPHTLTAVFTPTDGDEYASVTATTPLFVSGALTTQMASAGLSVADADPPTITSTTPSDLATAVSVNVKVKAVFNEQIQPSSLNFVLRDSDGGIVNADVAFDTATLTATLTPLAALNGSRIYRARIDSAMDLAGNQLAAPIQWQFTTALPGFQESVVFSNLEVPTVVQFAKDGRVFVAEKSGIIRVFASIDATTSTVFADLRTNVYNFLDRGLLGMALHPNFPDTPYVYVLYTFDGPINGTAPTWGTVGGTSDDCPTPPGPEAQGCVASGRLSRLTASGNQMLPGSETVLIHDWFQQFPSHSLGALVFGEDGALYAGAGEAASYNYVDYGQTGNPAGDPPLPAGTPLSPPSAEGGALRAQDLRTRSDPQGLDGTVIRIDPLTGLGMPDNPLASDSEENARRIVGYGFRNPFRFAIRPGTSEVWIGDVGWNLSDEIDLIPNPTALSAPMNFGWPCYEGAGAQDGYAAAGLTLCQQLYNSPGSVTAPYFFYNRGSAVVPGEACGTGGATLSGLAFNSGDKFPANYQGALFIADYSRSCIWVMFPGPDGRPAPGTVSTFRADASTPVDLRFHDGDLYYVDIFGGKIRRIRYFSGNQPPTASVLATPSAGPLPLVVNFDARGSSDPDDGALSYSWDLNGDGVFGDSTAAQPAFTYTTAGVFTVSLRVTDPQGLSDTTSVEILAGGAAYPEPFIDLPTGAVPWKVGDVISFQGGATDANDGVLPPSALSWSLLIHHCSTTCHVHAFQDFAGVASGSFVAPDHDYPSHLELKLTATDSTGLQRTVSKILMPSTVEATFQTAPSGLKLTVGAETQTAPFVRTLIQGGELSVSASTLQSGGAPFLYQFSSWSDGGAATHNTGPLNQSQTLTATYVLSTIPSTTATFLGYDATTKGSWRNVYGADGRHVVNEAVSHPAYATVSASNNQSFTWANSTSDVRALQKASGNDRIASTWYSATSMTIDVNFTDSAAHQLALYLLDWEGGGRAETIEVRDADTNAVLDTQIASSFQGGQYLRWTITGHVLLTLTRSAGSNAVVSGLFFDPAPSGNPGPTVALTAPTNGATAIAPATFNLAATATDSDGVGRVEFYAGATLIGTDHSSPYEMVWTNVPAGTYSLTARAYDSLGASTISAAVLVSVTPSGGGGDAAATFVAIDAATLGNWRGKYGADGYQVINDAASYPAYAAVTPIDVSVYTWADPSTDPRALQRAVGTSRQASTWYRDEGPFSIDVNITDGAPHQLALYMVDWENGGRTQSVQIRDAVSNAILDERIVSAFVGGQYWRWSIQGHVRITFTQLGLRSPVVSGLFFGDLLTDNTPPTVTLTSPVNGATAVAPALFTVAATAADDDGIDRVEFYANGALIGTDGAAPYEVQWTNVAAGDYNITARAYDARGASTTTSPVHVTVTSAPGSGAGAAFVATDTTTRGDWRGRYGADGYHVVNDAVSYPSYAVVTPGNASIWTWSASTTDQRALQRAVGAERLAATWYRNDGPFTLDINLVDGQPHEVAMYMVDWETGGRTQTIEIRDAQSNALLDTRTVSAFSGGQYWRWTLKGHVIVSAAKTTGPNPVISGLFFGTPGSGNVGPVVALTSPANGATGIAPATFTVSATASDSDGVSRVEFYADATLIGTDSTSPYELSWTAIPAGTYSVTARAYDALGASTTSAPVQVVVAPATGGNGAASFAGTDVVTHGTWRGIYGTDGYNVVSDTSNYPAYATVTTSNASIWTWADPTADPRGLQRAAGSSRLAATWYRNTGPFTIDINLTDGFAHDVALYMVDWEFAWRTQLIEIRDAATNDLLDSRTVSAFSDGQYWRWTLRGHVRISVGKIFGPSAVVGGVFFGPPTVGNTGPTVVLTSPEEGAALTAPGAFVLSAAASDDDGINRVEFYAGAALIGTDTTLPYSVPWEGVPAGSYTLTARAYDNFGMFTTSAPVHVTVEPPGGAPGGATYLGMDITTLGNWQNIYGTDGYHVASDVESLPSYAQVTTVNASIWTWADPTADPRALRRASGTSRIAATWYRNDGPFSIDVNITDGATHEVSLYVIDWESGGRVQTFEIRDAATNALLDTRTITNFSGGRYVRWSLRGHVTISVNKSAGRSAVVSGVFFD